MRLIIQSDILRIRFNAPMVKMIWQRHEQRASRLPNIIFRSEHPFFYNFFSLYPFQANAITVSAIAATARTFCTSGDQII